ncbi:MAG TPA: glycerophosphodiester phosphodiesterase [Acidimicrobiales bacterium]|nr:glycerophosphodiester phosphodiesterase [Acidimicrobiales bacterium]
MARVASRRQPPIGFAHRGASAHAAENTLEAFALAVRLGATGLESDVWVTADGVPVLDHDGVVRRSMRKRPIAEVRRDELPEHIPSLADLYERCGTELPLSLDVKDPAAFAPTVDVARTAGAAERLWLCHPDWQLVATWRRSAEEVKLVDSTRIGKLKDGVERRAMDLRDAGIDCINLHESDWTAGLTTLFHRFDLECFGWDAQLPRVLSELLAKGVDAVYSDHVDRMVDALAAHAGP